MRDRLDALVHPGVAGHDGERGRHRLFLASRLGVGAAALAGLPVLLAFEGAGSGAGLVAAASPGLLLVAAAIVSWSGRLALGFLATSLALGLFAGALWCSDGAASSLALSCLLLAPIDAVASGRARIVLLATFLAGLAATLLMLAVPGGPGASTLLAFLGIDVAAGSLGWLAVRALGSPDERAAGGAVSRAAVERVGDMVGLHDACGDLVQVDGCRGLLGVASGELHGSRLLARLHLADRPAYLRAILEAGGADAVRTILLRIRGGARGEGAEREAYTLCEMRLRASAGEPASARRIYSITRRVAQAEDARRIGETDGRRGQGASRALLVPPAEQDATAGRSGPVQAAKSLHELLRERVRDVA